MICSKVKEPGCACSDAEGIRATSGASAAARRIAALMCEAIVFLESMKTPSGKIAIAHAGQAEKRAGDNSCARNPWARMSSGRGLPRTKEAAARAMAGQL